jgi:hypothetical protein
MPFINANTVRAEQLLKRLEECQPRILVVTDKLSFDASNGRGLTTFVEALRNSTVHGLTPIVTTAQFGISEPQTYDADTRHIEFFRFTDPEHGVSRSHYDVVFLMADSGDAPGELQLSDEKGALEAVTAFMQQGGGLFATGDHENLGAGMCARIPRVRSMRYWKLEDAPSRAGVDRLSTLMPGRGDVVGSNDEYEVSDGSDRFPQALYVNFLTQAAPLPFLGVQRLAHPVLQVGAARAIEVFPDHANEGECVIPKDLEAMLPDGEREWPLQISGQPAIGPEMVALSMSHGNAISATRDIPERLAVAPRSFIAIAAYDGQRCGVGRVVTDSSYFHFVNTTIGSTASKIEGRDRSDILQYYTNLVTWLTPRDQRRRQRQAWLVGELKRNPTFHEFPSRSEPKLDGPRALELGALVQGALLDRHTASTVYELMQDALEDAIGLDFKRELETFGTAFGAASARDTAVAALGALTVAIAERFNTLALQDDVDLEHAFDGTEKASAAVAKRYLAPLRGRLVRLGELLDTITHGGGERPSSTSMTSAR